MWFKMGRGPGKRKGVANLKTLAHKDQLLSLEYFAQSSTVTHEGFPQEWDLRVSVYVYTHWILG